MSAAVVYALPACLLNFSAIQPEMYATKMNDNRNPPVGLINTKGPPCKPANIGSPAVPTRIYVIIAKEPKRFPSIRPAMIAKNVWSDSGTLVPPIGTASMGNHIVIFAPTAIRQTNTAPKVKSIGLKCRKEITPLLFINIIYNASNCQPEI